MSFYMMHDCSTRTTVLGTPVLEVPEPPAADGLMSSSGAEDADLQRAAHGQYDMGHGDPGA